MLASLASACHKKAEDDKTDTPPVVAPQPAAAGDVDASTSKGSALADSAQYVYCGAPDGDCIRFLRSEYDAEVGGECLVGDKLNKCDVVNGEPPLGVCRVVGDTLYGIPYDMIRFRGGMADSREKAAELCAGPGKTWTANHETTIGADAKPLSGTFGGKDWTVARAFAYQDSSDKDSYKIDLFDASGPSACVMEAGKSVPTFTGEEGTLILQLRVPKSLASLPWIGDDIVVQEGLTFVPSHQGRIEVYQASASEIKGGVKIDDQALAKVKLEGTFAATFCAPK